MYTTINAFLADWDNENQATQKIFAELTDSSLDQKVSPDGRSLGRLAWHITQTLGEMMGRLGLSVETPAEDAPVPLVAGEILLAYKHAALKLGEQIRERWSDASLEESTNMYGEDWKNTFSLAVLVRHQIHHRAQMTVLMRQAGLFVPGIYGPSKEEWTKYGMPAAL